MQAIISQAEWEEYMSLKQNAKKTRSEIVEKAIELVGMNEFNEEGKRVMPQWVSNKIVVSLMNLK